MENILHITRRSANTKINATFLMCGNNIERFRMSYGRLRQRVQQLGSTIVSITVNRKGEV